MNAGIPSNITNDIDKPPESQPLTFRQILIKYQVLIVSFFLEPRLGPSSILYCCIDYKSPTFPLPNWPKIVISFRFSKPFLSESRTFLQSAPTHSMDEMIEENEFNQYSTG